MNAQRLQRRLLRLTEQRDKLLAEHQGRETEFTYWGGYSLGYVKGKITEIEDRLADYELPCDKVNTAVFNGEYLRIAYNDFMDSEHPSNKNAENFMYYLLNLSYEVNPHLSDKLLKSWKT